MFLKTIIAFVFVVLIAGGILFISQKKTPPLLSPLSTLISPITSFINPPHLKPQKVVYGFLPYWTLDEANIRHPLVTHLAYFGVDYDTSGHILTRTEEGFIEPGYRHLSGEQLSKILRQNKSSGGKTILVLRAMTTEIIENIVNNKTKSLIAVEETLELAKAKNFDGINIDFEYVGTPSTQTKKNFSSFVAQLSSACKLAIPGCVISIDVFADSATKDRIWDFPSINPHVDHIIVMAYDFFRASSSQAGPVSPLRGSCSRSKTPICLDYDISQSMADMSRILPTSKVILGVPFYGYQWQTAGRNFLANTYDGTGHIATYKRVQELLAVKNSPNPLHRNEKVKGIETHWDEETLTPRLVFQDQQNDIQQIYYEDTRSLSLKYDLVNQSGLGGIAIWALGYEGNYTSPWQLIQAKFFTTN